MNNTNALSVFLVEDSPTYASALKYDITSNVTKNIKVYESGEDCLKNIELNPDVVLLDYSLPGKLNGIGVLQKIKKRTQNTEVIFISGQENLEVAINAMKYGAYDYIVKNETAFIRAKNLIGKIAEHKNLREENKISKVYKMLFFLSWALTILSIIFLGRYMFA